MKISKRKKMTVTFNPTFSPKEKTRHIFRVLYIYVFIIIDLSLNKSGIKVGHW